MFPRLYVIAAAVAFSAISTSAAAQDPYETFVGDWVASALIARSCPGMTTLNQQGAADVARAQHGLSRQKVLRLLYYSKRVLLEQQGNAALSNRNLSLTNKKRLCQFGRSVAGKNDTIGRFLRVN